MKSGSYDQEEKVTGSAVAALTEREGQLHLEKAAEQQWENEGWRSLALKTPKEVETKDDTSPCNGAALHRDYNRTSGLLYLPLFVATL